MYVPMNGNVIVKIIKEKEKKKEDHGLLLPEEKPKLNLGLQKGEIICTSENSMKPGTIVYFKKEFAVEFEKDLKIIEEEKILVKEEK